MQHLLLPRAIKALKFCLFVWIIPATDLELRLVGGTTPSEGRVEVSLPGGESATISDNMWTMADGNVVCRHLGFSGAGAVFTTEQFGPGLGRLYFSDVSCSGEEENLLDCYLMAADEGNTDHSKDVGVSCVEEESRVARSTDSQLCDSSGTADSTSCVDASAQGNSDSETSRSRTIRSALRQNGVDGENGTGSQNGTRSQNGAVRQNDAGGKNVKYDKIRFSSIKEHPDFQTLMEKESGNRRFSKKAPGRCSYRIVLNQIFTNESKRIFKCTSPLFNQAVICYSLHRRLY